MEIEVKVDPNDISLELGQRDGYNIQDQAFRRKLRNEANIKKDEGEDQMMFYKDWLDRIDGLVEDMKSFCETQGVARKDKKEQTEEEKQNAKNHGNQLIKH